MAICPMCSRELFAFKMDSYFNHAGEEIERLKKGTLRYTLVCPFIAPTPALSLRKPYK